MAVAEADEEGVCGTKTWPLPGCDGKLSESLFPLAAPPAATVVLARVMAGLGGADIGSHVVRSVVDSSRVLAGDIGGSVGFALTKGSGQEYCRTYLGLFSTDGE